MERAIFHFIDKAPTPVAPYSHAVESAPWLFVTGQLPIDPRNEAAPLPDGIEAQTRKVFENLIAVLRAADYDLSDVISARVFLTRFDDDYEVMNRIYAGYFPADRRPARTCVGVTGLARSALVEIDFIARKGA
jgi:reactive intermediate/imine deaminase